MQLKSMFLNEFEIAVDNLTFLLNYLSPDLHNNSLLFECSQNIFETNFAQVFRNHREKACYCPTNSH